MTKETRMPDFGGIKINLGDNPNVRKRIGEIFGERKRMVCKKCDSTRFSFCEGVTSCKKCGTVVKNKK